MNVDKEQARRRTLYVNRHIQGALILRSVLHWYFYMCAILLTVVIFTVIRNPSQLALKLVFQSFIYFSPAIIASLVLLPLFVFDILKASHRMVGPIHRLRTEMATLAEGKEINDLRFRNGDHWFELAEEFNELAKQVMEERRAGRQEQAEPVVG